MKRILSIVGAILSTGVLAGTVTGPDGRLAVSVETDSDGVPRWQVLANGQAVTEKAALGLLLDCGDFTQNLKIVDEKPGEFRDHYSLKTIKTSSVEVEMNTLTVAFAAPSGEKLGVEFRVGNRDVAFRYAVPRQRKGGTGCVRVMDERTTFAFPEGTTQFTCPQSNAMIGWKRSKPSYEEEYVVDAPVGVKGRYGKGWTFPCLFRTGETWLLVSETGTDSNYCGCRLGESKDRAFKVEFPMPEENNGNGTVEPAFALPGVTPWRTLTVGSLKDIVETTVAWDVVKPKYETTHDYVYGPSSWSWIVWDDASMNWNDQVAFVDLAAAMGWKYILVDAGWDTNLGKREEGRAKNGGEDHSIEALIAYAQTKGIGVFLWYSSSGWWNDIVQSPINVMCDPIARKREMRWMEKLGVKGIKVDFWGGDKQETFRLYEQVMSDADDHGLMTIFHGCTIPRGWERMYPNYVGSEAVLASENHHFSQYHRDRAALNATLHPFIRNALGCMEFGGTFLNKSLEKTNKGNRRRRTSDWAECATAVLFQNPIQNFAITPNNLTDAPADCIAFMKTVPTTWDETRFLAGYPGRFVVLARRHGTTWYVAGIANEDVTCELDLAFAGGAKETIAIRRNDGFVRVMGSAGSSRRFRWPGTMRRRP